LTILRIIFVCMMMTFSCIFVHVNSKIFVMEAIIIEGNKNIIELIRQLSGVTGAKVKNLSNKQLLEFQTGNRLKAEKTGKRVPKSEIMKILQEKQK